MSVPLRERVKNSRQSAWIVLALVVAPGIDASAAGSDVLLDLIPISTGTSWSSPVAGVTTPGDPNGLYIVESTLSRVRRFDLITNQITDFIDLPDVPSNAGGERGLVGMAFHPDYANNGKIYVHNYDGTNIEIIELTRQQGNSTVDSGSANTILSFSHNVTGATIHSHAAGWIGFSQINGYLYVPTGDGGAGTCQNCALPAQDLNDLRGKLLRIDVNSDQFPGNPLKDYAIPGDNPFVGGGGEPEIFAYGLRHPWRAGFDSLTGDLYIGDVGSSHFEEVNLVPATGPSGLNFGWRALEGVTDTPQFPDPPPANAQDPLYFYAHGVESTAITGGIVYRGSDIPALEGHYIFADFVKGTVATFDPTGGIVNDFIDRTSEIGIGNITNFVEDLNGEIYIIRRNGQNPLYKLIGYLRGDFNRDGSVDALDLAQWQGDYGLNTDSDADQDGDTDGADFLIWQRQLGMGAMPSASQTVPEPFGASLLWSGMLYLASLPGRKPFI